MSNRTYDEKDLGVGYLVGKTVISAKINEHKDAVLLETKEGEKIYLGWSGDCCAHCYIAHFNNPEYLIGHKILEAEHTEWSDIKTEDDYGVLEKMGTKIKTTKGYVDIETRVSHNGYYGGNINISTNGFIDAYSCLRDIEDVGKLKPLEEF